MPRSLSSSIMLRMSARSGTPRSVLGPSAKSDAAMIGSEAFFEPLTSTAPLSLPPPVTISLSMRCSSPGPLPSLTTPTDYRAVARRTTPTPKPASCIPWA